MLAVVALLLVGQLPCGPEGPIFCGGESFAFFEFAPLSGKGMTAPCACTAPTGAKGEAMTFTRASSGTCLKGGTVSGIANGDLVTCTDNQPRVMPGGDGTGGVGLLVEGARTNLCLRSAEIDNAAWTKEQDAAPRTPVVTANAATGPDGAATADRVQLGATAAGEYSDFYQSATVGANGDAWACSAFVKGNATSDSTDICRYDGLVWTCATCAYVSTSWTRCSIAGTGQASTTRYCKLGNNTLQNGGVARNAADIFVVGLQGEVGLFASSYIATAGASATRAQETATFPVAMSQTAGSHAVTFVPGWSAGGVPYLLTYDTNARMIYGNSDVQSRIYDGTTEVNNATTYVAGTAKRLWSSYSGSSMSINDGADTTSGSFDGTMGSGALTTLTICNGVGSFAFGVCKRVCAQPDDTTRCR